MIAVMTTVGIIGVMGIQTASARPICVNIVLTPPSAGFHCIESGLACPDEVIIVGSRGQLTITCP